MFEHSNVETHENFYTNLLSKWQHIPLGNEAFLFASRSAVIPAHAGIHVFLLSKQLQRRQDVDPGIRRDDGSASSVQA
jgi:hypothetical protein